MTVEREATTWTTSEQLAGFGLCPCICRENHPGRGVPCGHKTDGSLCGPCQRLHDEAQNGS